jgi:hypothetical protein
MWFDEKGFHRKELEKNLTGILPGYIYLIEEFNKLLFVRSLINLAPRKTILSAG